MKTSSNGAIDVATHAGAPVPVESLRARTIFAVVVLAAASACTKDKTAPVDAGASPSSPSATTVVAPDGSAPTALLSAREANAILEKACFSCHSVEMVMQQRLTPAQWAKVVDKMVKWGANLEEVEKAPLVTWLSSSYFVDAGVYPPQHVPVADAPAELEPKPDPRFEGGDAERGKTLYVDKCSGCHGNDAKGHIGTNLVDKPFLYRPADVAETIRRGRGKMTPMSLTDPQIADIVAYLRGLTN